MPGEPVISARVAADGTTLWWAVAKEEPIIGSVYSNWLLATTTSGEPVVAPTEIAPGDNSAYDPDVVATPSAIVTKFSGVQLSIRRFARDGSPLAAAVPVTVDAAHVNLNDTALIATADGGAQLVTSLQSDTAEAAIVDINAAGFVGATHTAGTPESDAGAGYTVAGTIAAAARPDGTTLLAWDRNFNACVSTTPSKTLTTVFDGAAVSAPQSVYDLPDSESRPVIAASGDAAFVAWTESSANGARIAIARYPDVTNVLAEIGNGIGYNVAVQLAMTSPDRGAITWQTDPGPGVWVMAFEDHGGTLLLGAPRLVPTVEDGSSAYAAGLVAVGNDRYVIGWIEDHGTVLDSTTHLYATQIDLAAEAMRPAPPVVPDVSVQPRRVRCP